MNSGWQKNLGVSSAYVAAVVAAALALSVAGCGGGSSSAAHSSSGGTASATAETTPANTAKTAAARDDKQAKAQLIARADKICRRLNAELETTFPKSQSRKEVFRVVPRHVASEQKALRELEKLTVPTSFAGEWLQMLSYRQALASELAKLVESERRNDKAAVKALAATKRSAHVALQATAKSGFKDCAQLG